MDLRATGLVIERNFTGDGVAHFDEGDCIGIWACGGDRHLLALVEFEVDISPEIGVCTCEHRVILCKEQFAIELHGDFIFSFETIEARENEVAFVGFENPTISGVAKSVWLALFVDADLLELHGVLDAVFQQIDADIAGLGWCENVELTLSCGGLGVLALIYDLRPLFFIEGKFDGVLEGASALNIEEKMDAI